ncbi:uncharacterized protein C2845_PM02G02400 [Panicum miliaceum]|uniref:F-box domain-containing protein n=1 Tax=Panicum miliaceum TaxID=4540 RepID=A0A3L6SAR2_PANMI|nr:uncharacterized protein C2845_PM02G02400 [Panicum miliaceum]
MEMDKNMDMMTGLLPEDALAAVLSRLAPRGLAACRCVCRAWRAVIDARGLLRADLLPLSVGGVYLDVSYCGFPPLFRRPSAAIRADLDYLGTTTTDDDANSSWSLQGHCNGLLLFPEHVVNPAMRQVARFPPRPAQASGDEFHRNMYLLFDPTVSPHYEVFSIPAVPYEEGAEWPPSLNLYGSGTNLKMFGGV